MINMKSESMCRVADMKTILLWNKIILVWNVVAMVILAILWGYASWIVSISGPLRFTELDRAGVVHEDKLREAFPNLADNPRRDVGLWLTEGDRKATFLIASAGIVIALVNLGLLLSSLYSRVQESPEDSNSCGI